MNSAREEKTSGRGCACRVAVWTISQQTAMRQLTTLIVTLFLIIHVGANDIIDTRPEELLKKYRRMIQWYKSKSNKIIVLGILPRNSAPKTLYYRTFSNNYRPKSLCKDEGIDFINCWDDFYNKPFLFKDDGLHLNPVRVAGFGRLLSNNSF